MPGRTPAAAAAGLTSPMGPAPPSSGASASGTPPIATPCSCAATARSNRGMWTPTSIGGERCYANVCSIASGRSAADEGWVPHALPLRMLVAVLIAVAAVIVTAGPLRSQLAGQGVGDEHSLVAPGPFTASRTLPPLAPSLPEPGPNGAAIWLHGDREPAAVGLLRAAGIPAIVVHRFDNAARHPLVLSWPATRLGTRGRAKVLAYVRHGGTFLAVAPNKAVRAAIGAGHAAFFTRLVQVPERGLESGGHLRDSQIAALRRFWAATPGGFRLGDA